jgi:hypothetical protein
MSATTPTYAEAFPRLLDAAIGILRTELTAELAATSAALGFTLVPPATPDQIRAGNLRALSDVLPCVDLYVMRTQIAPGDILRRGDTLESVLMCVLYCGEETVGSTMTVPYTRALYAYTMAIAGLLVRELPSSCMQGTGVIDAVMSDWQLDTRLNPSIFMAESPVALSVTQAVRPDRPIPPVTP